MRLANVPRPNRRNTRLACRCGGYHFPHRKTGGACNHGPRHAFYQSLRCGCDYETALSYLTVEVRDRMLRWFADGGLRPRVRALDDSAERLAA